MRLPFSDESRNFSFYEKMKYFKTFFATSRESVGHTGMSKSSIDTKVSIFNDDKRYLN